MNPATPTLADWPTYQHDSSRSGSTTEKAPSSPSQIWSYQAPTRPIPAWDEPALWDGWSKTHDLRNRQVFDKAFHVAVVEDRVYFGSSIDEKIYCLDANSGQVLWQFFTDGPVRLAPTIAGDRVYVGSDDGFVYCLDRVTGKLFWKKTFAPDSRRVAGNGRVVSPWAIRTSVVVNGDTAYCGAGVIPNEGVYVVAMNANTGDEIWKSEMKDLPAQGYMLASQTRLYVVTSRDTPIVLDAQTGKRLHKVKGGVGGTYALLTGDTLLYGPSKTGDVNMIGEQQDVLASFQGNHMIVAQPLSFLQSKSELSSLDRGEYVRLYGQRNAVARQKAETEKRVKKAKEEKNTSVAESLQTQVDELTKKYEQIGEDLKACLKWRIPCECPFSLILANGVLIAGGEGEVIAVDASNGERLWQRNVAGKAYGLAVSDGRLYVSTDEGVIHCFADGANTGDDVDPITRHVKLQSYVGPIASTEKIPPEIHGPFAEFIAPGKIRIQWDTTIPMTSQLAFGVDMTNARTWQGEDLKHRHEFVVDDVQPEIVYRFQVGGTLANGSEIHTEAYRFDSHLNYLPPPTPTHPSPSPYADDANTDRYRQLAARMVEACGATRGYALVFAAEDGHLAYEIARTSDLKVIILEPDAQKAQQLREKLDATGMYGHRITVHEGDLGNAKYGPFLANLIVSESSLIGGELPRSAEAFSYCLRPTGGTLILGDFGNATKFEQWRESSELTWNKLEPGDRALWIHKRGKLPGTGEWTHQYASADNSACSHDDQIQGELMTLWWGRPGARPMPDRGNRNPPPVSANGRLYVQGNRTLFGLDAYNGTILWAKQIPTMRRANMPRDGSNMVAAEDHVCVAVRDQCVAFDGQTGERVRDFQVPEFSPLHEYDWGYVSRIGSQLFGTAVRRGAHYLGDKGEWYEGAENKDVARVTSDSIFSVNAYSGETEWLYSQGVLINSTITIADGRAYFIESRSDAARNAASGRMLDEVLRDQVLVSLDVATGQVIWEKPYDFSQCRYMTYMTHSNGTLLITGTDEKSKFHTYAFNAEDGKDLWQHEAAEKKGHHTGQLAHPTIVGDRVYFNKHTYELRTGQVLGVHDFNWHGCGVMSASSHAVFSRYEYHGMLDLKTNKRTEFLGVRSGCWLSLIPSGGLLLAPETSAGCSCGHSIQTSMAYVPKSVVENVTKGQSRMHR